MEEEVAMTEPVISIVGIDLPDGVNLVFGQSHFIKTVEDLYEALVGSSPECR